MTDPEIMRTGTVAVDRLAKHGLTVKSDGTFHVITNSGRTISKPATVDGLTSLCDGLDWAFGTDSAK